MNEEIFKDTFIFRLFKYTFIVCCCKFVMFAIFCAFLKMKSKVSYILKNDLGRASFKRLLIGFEDF